MPFFKNNFFVMRNSLKFPSPITTVKIFSQCSSTTVVNILKTDEIIFFHCHHRSKRLSHTKKSSSRVPNITNDGTGKEKEHT